MSNELSVLQSTLPVRAVDEASFNEIAKPSNFHPRIQLYGGNSDACKEGKIPIGRFGLVPDKETLIDLGPEILCIPLTFRFKAMDISDREAIVNSYDKNSELFQRIQAMADVQDSGCMFGIEFLVWLDERKTLATYYLSSVSARKEAGKLRAQLLKPTLIEAKLMSNKKYKWHGPKVNPSSDSVEEPDAAMCQAAMKAFEDAKDTEVASDEEVSNTSRER